jgi:hypothetical protein
VPAAAQAEPTAARGHGGRAHLRAVTGGAGPGQTGKVHASRRGGHDRERWSHGRGDSHASNGPGSFRCSAVAARAGGTVRDEQTGPVGLDMGVNGMYIREIGGVGTAPVFV